MTIEFENDSVKQRRNRYYYTVYYDKQGRGLGIWRLIHPVLNRDNSKSIDNRAIKFIHCSLTVYQSFLPTF